ncbi:MAG TPA: hypothetical protein VL500_02795 [Candidatus Eisenbacteria bacterium]|nr:hypothetical protein [Candidatus Eisenbacteria bacterium]
MKRRLKDLLFMPVDPSMGLLFCGIASLAIWLVAAYAPGVTGPLLGRVIAKPGTLPEGSQTWLLLLAFVPYVLGYRAVSRVPLKNARGVTAIFAALIAVVLVAKIVPFVSHDIFIYAFQGRAVAVHGVNPYEVFPSQIDDPFVPAMGEWLSGLKDTYGPLWTDVTAIAAAVAGDHYAALLAGLKGIAAMFFLAGIPLIALLVDADRKRPAALRDGAILLYAWNPALLLEFAGNGHNDSAMIFFLLLALVFAERRKHALSGLALAASFLMKHVTVLAVPFFAAQAMAAEGGPLRQRLRVLGRFVMPMAAATVVAYAPYWIGVATFHGLSQQATHVGMDIASPLAFAVAFAVGGPNGVLDQRTLDIAGPISFDLFAISMALLVFTLLRRKIGSLRRSAFAPVACYLAMACLWFMPWYLTWLAPVFVLEGAAAVAVTMGVADLLLYGVIYTGPLLGAAVVAAAMASTLLARASRPPVTEIATDV